MSSAISSYNSQYATWNRTRRLQTSPFLATENTGPAAAAARLAANETLILNMNDVNTFLNSGSSAQTQSSKKPDTLFGPGVGVITSGPSWTEPKSPSKDSLTPEVVKAWMAKSKESSQPTTTLQALVNLKRPSLKLSPLSHPNDSSEGVHHQQHGLEFGYDCDAPKCGIKMHIVGQNESDKLLVFETLVDGGFGKVLKYDEGAVLELATFENKSEISDAAKPLQGIASSPPHHDEGTNTNSAEPNSAGNANRGRKRGSYFHFRKRAGNDERVAGPALQVVDADAPPASTAEGGDDVPSTHPTDTSKMKEEGGVKVTICLEALDEDGHSLASMNSQLTYLHIVRLGSAPADEEEDRRPWVVKVVRREAAIGAHTFHLHEIYGLTSASSQNTSLSTSHAYPPAGQGDDQTSECLLCLSSPREVVLLPCRHLVACKECAVNMVEFGAGGTLVHAESNPTPAAESGTVAADSEPVANGEQSATPAVPTPSLPANVRRKRKAKGWYCPVCRQPYTSLLRITTVPPEKDCAKDSTSQESLMPATQTTTAPAAASLAPNGTLDMRSLFPRPNFLRSLSRPAGRPSAAGANMV